MLQVRRGEKITFGIKLKASYKELNLKSRGQYNIMINEICLSVSKGVTIGGELQWGPTEFDFCDVAWH